MKSIFHRITRAADAILPNESIHYLMAKTHYQAALHCANVGSTYWFDAARRGFDAHVSRLQELDAEKDRASNRNLPNWIQHCEELADGLKQAKTVARQIRHLLLYKQPQNAQDTDRTIRKRQEDLRKLHLRLRPKTPPR
ncbi:hypothetical protein HYV43_07065 [Candidatus Micrarchaeota archaeon]|nr:hypothetical protein [Candidatus Micrarchaeota archaeon]